jgi:phospholipid transport system transporter-binding protein
VYSVNDSNTFTVNEPMTFQTVPELFARSSQWLQGRTGAVVFDLQHAERADSAGIALLVEWIEQARAQQCDISFVNLPSQIEDLVRLNDLTPLLHQHASS